jgi:hypothetical protein
MCLSMPKAPPPPPLPAPPPEPARMNDEGVAAARDDTRMRARLSRGSAGSVLSSQGSLSPAAVGTTAKLLGQ